jgi:hypothetical protein
MKKEIIEFRISEFTDFAGETRKFIFAAVSEMLPTVGEDSDGNELDVNYDVIEFVSDDSGVDYNYENTVVKKLSIGVSVQNAKDKFDEDLGIKIAIGKAKKRPVGVFYCTTTGLISAAMVSAVLDNEVKHFKSNPGMYIAGYDKAAAKWTAEQKGTAE